MTVTDTDQLAAIREGVSAAFTDMLTDHNGMRFVLDAIYEGIRDGFRGDAPEAASSSFDQTAITGAIHQAVTDHLDLHPQADLGFHCSECGQRTISALSRWNQWYTTGDIWDETCAHCGTGWSVRLTATRKLK